MANGQLMRVLSQLRWLARPAETDQLSDAALLEQFLSRRDEAAFATLVRRHGPMVQGVCRRLLRDPDDADDAFQATFLVLVRKAAALSRRELLANWLYGVAYRTALKARGLKARRLARERQADMSAVESTVQPGWDDLQPLLDQELNRLPRKYRAPMVLCELEGKSRKEAAELLGCPEGTLSSRLARARELLGRRLARRGVALSAGALATLLVQYAAPSAVASPLVSVTVSAALATAAGQSLAAGVVSAHVAALTEGVLKAMAISKLKVAAIVFLALGLVGTGAGVATHYALADRAGQQSVEIAAFVAEPGDDAVVFDGDNFYFEADGALADAGDKPAKAAGDKSQPPKPDLSGRITDVAADGKAITLELPPKNKGEAPEKLTIRLTEPSATRRQSGWRKTRRTRPAPSAWAARKPTPATPTWSARSPPSSTASRSRWRFRRRTRTSQPPGSRSS
jgi:RNA polymerase sigma factor (sigma-70 family)